MKTQDEINALLDKCKNIAFHKDILAEFDEEITRRGFVGSTSIPKLAYLAFLTSAQQRPVSMVIKGPSGSGKSFSLTAAMQFVPEFAYQQFEGMSEKALVYLPNLDLKHKHLVIGEAAGLAEGEGRSLLRQLLSEDRVRYATVQSTDKEGLTGKELPILEGPTGLIMTTTANGLHPEDESRMLSVSIPESQELIGQALMAQALGAGKPREPIDKEVWHSLFEYAQASNAPVIIPYLPEIAKRLPRTHDRIKRDFPQLISLISAHALLHSCTRPRGEDGSIIATVDDYAAVRELTNEPLSQGLAVTVSDSIKEVVEGVRKCLEEPRKGQEAVGISQTKLAEFLKRDPSVVSRNVKKALEEGYLQNANPGQGREARLTLGELKLPSGSILPTVEQIVAT